MIDHVGIYGSRVAEGLSAFNVGLVSVIVGCIVMWLSCVSVNGIIPYWNQIAADVACCDLMTWDSARGTRMYEYESG